MLDREGWGFGPPVANEPIPSLEAFSCDGMKHFIGMQWAREILYSLPLEIHLAGVSLSKTHALTICLFSYGLSLVIQPIVKS